MIQYHRLVVVAAMLAATGAVFAKDLRAVAEDGRKVLLSPDGKWRFDTNLLSATVPDTGSPYRLSAKRFSVAFDSSAWTLQAPQDEDGPSKRSFQHKSLPIYGLIIGDEMPTTTPVLKSVMLHNAKSAGAETTVLLDEMIKIGDKDVGSFRMAAKMKGIDFMFWSYYFANEDGNVQVTCFTAQSLFHKYEAECRKFLASFRID